MQFMQNMHFMQNIQLNILHKYPQSNYYIVLKKFDMNLRKYFSTNIF